MLSSTCSLPCSEWLTDPSLSFPPLRLFTSPHPVREAQWGLIILIKKSLRLIKVTRVHRYLVSDP